MHASELRTKTSDELVDLYEDMKETLYKLRLSHSTGELVDTTEFRRTRHDVARILTVLREKELAAEIVEEEK